MPTTYWAFPTQTFTAWDANGDPVASAEAKYFEAGTSTPLTIYTDTALTTPHAVPQVADGNGVFAVAYISGADDVKIEVRTPAGALLPGYPVDNITGIPVGGLGASQIVFVATALLAVDNVQDALEILEDITQGQHTIWIPAGAITPTDTNGATFATEELATNDVMIVGLDFDQSTRQNAQFSFQSPKGADVSAGLIFQAVWKDADTAGSGDVTFGFEVLATSNDDALDAAFGTPQTATDTFIASGDNHTGPETSAVTPSGTWLSEDLLIAQVYRDISDDYTQPARLIGIRCHYTTDANTDS